MFCFKCGRELNENMTLCPSCGTVVAKEKCIAGSEYSSDHRDQDVVLPLLGRSVAFDRSIKAYAEIREMFEEYGQDTYDDFISKFYSTYRDMDDLMNKLGDDIQNIFDEGIAIINGILSKEGIFGITDEEVSAYLQKYCTRTYNVMLKIEEQYDQIIARQEGMSQYRQQRKAGRGRVVGGGFGLSGAIKGMATAGAINMATGALHSVGNVIGSMGSAISAASAKGKLFNESNLPYHLCSALQDDIFMMHLVVIDLSNAHSEYSICRYTPDDEARANKIRRDIEDGIIPDPSLDRAVVSMLAIDPFSISNYKLAIKLFPKRIDEMMDFFYFFGHNAQQLFEELRAQLDPAVGILLEYQNYIPTLLINVFGVEGDVDVEPLTTDLDDMLEYFSGIFDAAREKGFFFLSTEGSSGKSKLNGAKNSYANYGVERPLLLYDSTLSGSGKEGFLITNCRAYLKGTGKGCTLPLSVAIENIHQGMESNGCTYLYFNDYGIHLLNAGTIVSNQLTGDFVELIISLILFLSSIRMQSSDLWTAIEQYCALSMAKTVIPKNSTSAVNSTDISEKQYCFECGAENEGGAAFCFECGAALT